MKSDWSPELYLKYAEERSQPAVDLLAKVSLDSASNIFDLGCGPGNSTALLLAQFPAARVVGVDSSPAMLEKARAETPRAEYVLADLADWHPGVAADLIFANATMQWVPEHLPVMQRLRDALRPGGWLAVQMPDNLNEPSHSLMRKVASLPQWSSRLAPASTHREQLCSAHEYYDALCHGAAKVKLWRTTYYHRLESYRAMIEFVSSTGLRPYMEPLAPEEQRHFKDIYESELRAAYPPLSGGGVLLTFPRLFIVLQR